MAKQNVPRQDPTAKFAGFTDGQVVKLFERIASNAHLMASICRLEAERAGIENHALVFHSLAVMVSGIGLMADAPTGGAVAGDFADWMVGPLFNENKAGA